jgi:hypothetical protein
MSQRTATQVEKKSAAPLVSGLLRHTAVRPLADHETPVMERPGPGFEHDFSQMAVRSTRPVVGQYYGTQACPVFPRTCPFGGACHTCPLPVQAKLKVNRPGDKYEQEADRVAEQVTRMPAPDASAIRESPIQLQIGAQVQSDVAQKVQAVRSGGGRPLNALEKDFFEPRFGFDFSKVRIYGNTKADAAVRAVAARAYTYKTDIVMRSGAYVPGTGSGQQLLAHELTHVVQQSESRTPKASFIQRDEAEDAEQANQTTCSITAKRETFGTGFCISGTTNAPDGTRVSFYYTPGMTSCNRSELNIAPPFGRTTVSRGGFSWRAPTNIGSPIPGVGRLFGAIIGSAVCCTRPRPGRC